jgi:glycosyltransferase involved in cell wall biosynthesis
MKFLFLHSNFPAQFRHLITVLAQDPGNQVIFGTTRQEGEIAGVKKFIYKESRAVSPQTHHYVRPLESAVLQGQAVYAVCQQLKNQGFYPDIVYAHSGWGPGLFIKDIFPKTKFLAYFEWFYHAHGSDADFDPADPLNADAEARIRIKNATILIDMVSCDRGLSPTIWQKQQFPREFHSKLTVLHDGIDTDYFCPRPDVQLVIPEIGLDLSGVKEIVTYATRGMEPYRGFPQFMTAVSLILARRPNCHVVIVGEDRVAYGKTLPDGKTYKQLMLESLSLDLSRVHFTGSLPYGQYKQVLQASAAHIYLTRPFVLSWSMLEAMAMGCVVIGSDTPPVRELITDGENGLLVDFFSPQQIADRVDEVLDYPQGWQNLRLKARETIKQRYDLKQCLQDHLDWLLS